jgi:hypothetical protein
MKDGLYVRKPYKMLVEEYGADADGSVSAPNGGAYFMLAMDYLPQVISVTDNECCAHNGKRWTVEDWMLLGPYYEWGEEVEVSDGGEYWNPYRFLCYVPIPGRSYKVAVMDDNGCLSFYRYVRKPEKPKTLDDKIKQLARKYGVCDQYAEFAREVKELKDEV